MANINVLVVVDTVNITQENLAQTVVLVDDKLDVDKKIDDSKTFTIHAVCGDSIKFRITAVNMETAVAFKGFAWEDVAGSSHCMDPMPNEKNDWTGIAQGNPGDHENFSITFSVAGNKNRPFTLDPDIQLDPPG